MAKQTAQSGPNTLMPQRSGHPSVKNMAPGPQSRQIDAKLGKAPAPNRNQTAGSKQSGSTSPKTDGGGGMGNDSAALHRMICGK